MMLIDVPLPAQVDPEIDDRTLYRRVVELAKQERQLRVLFIIFLGVFEGRRLHLKAGYPSLFAWLTGRLKFRNASAFRRSTAAALCRRMPVCAVYLHEGRISLTKLCCLRESLAPENCVALLEQAASMTEREVEVLAAQLHPDAVTRATRDSIRPLVTRPAATQCDLFAAAASAPPAAPSPMDAPAPPVATSPQTAPAPQAEPPPVTPPPVRHLVRMTVGAEFLRLLDDVRAALSHSHPGASLETLLGECMRTTLTVRHARTRGETKRPRASKPAADKDRSPSRHVPAALRREIWRRDGSRCTFVAADGTRCSATRRLEIHHDTAFALGGPTDLASCRLVCHAHNDLLARRDFGDEFVERAIADARCRRASERSADASLTSSGGSDAGEA